MAPDIGNSYFTVQMIEYYDTAYGTTPFEYNRSFSLLPTYHDGLEDEGKPTFVT